MTRILNKISAACVALLLTYAPAFAFEPHPAEIGLQAAATPNMVRLHQFHDNILFWVITGIVVFVFLLLAWVAIRYNARANPVPSQTTHNVPLEIIWTVVPVVILLIIAIPSYRLLFYLDRTAEPDMTVKVRGFQWYWTYAYADHKDASGEDLLIESRIIPEKELNQYIPDGKGRRLLETYNPVVLPIEKNIQILTSAEDVIHAWTVPAFGAKKDAVPGRTNETWFRVTEPGIYYGQCSEICGIDHASMPISVYAVTQAEYDSWIGCVMGEQADADYPSRACVQKLGFDKYRAGQKAHLAAAGTGNVSEQPTASVIDGNAKTDKPNTVTGGDQ